MALRRGQIHADKAQDFAAPSPQSGATSEADSDPIDQVSDTTDAHRSDITDYEDLRRRNMARNAAFLASVGLLPPATDLPGSNARYAAKPVKRSRREVVAAQARAGAEEAVTGDATPSLLLRRSTRVATLPNAPNYAVTYLISSVRIPPSFIHVFCVCVDRNRARRSHASHSTGGLSMLGSPRCGPSTTSGRPGPAG
jgi:hypothetical protein